MPLTDFAKQALTMVRPKVVEYWLSQVSSLSEEKIEALAEAVPEMSGPARRFSVGLVKANQRRLLDG